MKSFYQKLLQRNHGKVQPRCEIENTTGEEDAFAPKETTRLSFLVAGLRLENFPFVVLLLLATISLLSRIWLMSR
jgi:hypothetical protein